MNDYMLRQPEPEYMDEIAEAEAYALSDFSEVNRIFVERLLELTVARGRVEAVDLGTGPGDIPVRVCLARSGEVLPLAVVLIRPRGSPHTTCRSEAGLP